MDADAFEYPGVVKRLLEKEGVKSVRADVQLIIEIERECEDLPSLEHNPQRQRVISEEEVGEIATEGGWDYHGTIDIVSDFRVRDKATGSMNFKDE